MTQKIRGDQILKGTAGDALQFSAGYISGGAITDNLDGTIDVAAGEGLLRSSNNPTAELQYFPWAESLALTLTDNAKNYVYIDYNAGNPVVGVQVGGAGVSDNENDKFELVEVYREGTDLHITQHRQYANDAISRMQKRFYSVNELQRGGNSGLILGEKGTRNVTLTAGKLWVKLDENNISAIDTSGADTFDRYYYNGSAWVKTTGQTQWDNLQYNNIASGLVTMTNNRDSFQEFYIEPDGNLVSVYADAEYVTAGGAENAPVLSFVPPRLDGHALYVGRIVFEKSGATAISILSPFLTSLNGAVVTDHGLLAGLADDDHPQYSLLAGRSGGQVLIGGSDANDDLEFQTTSNASKGNYIFSELTTANGILRVDGSGNMTASVTLPDGTLGTTQSAGDNTTKIATTAFVQGERRNVPVVKTGNYVLADGDRILSFNNSTTSYSLTLNTSITIGEEGEVDKSGTGEITITKGTSVVFKSDAGDVNVKIDGDGTDSASLFWRKISSTTFKIWGNYKV
jgi:hypothetical protein